ncbi:MAG: hypothetical protein ACD_75C00210G0001 [uncultured bacterium]|nr:MAG: hypothetical protein ACD_75C00210G0001 [uncultured bacterium]
MSVLSEGEIAEDEAGDVVEFAGQLQLREHPVDFIGGLAHVLQKNYLAIP